MDLLPTGKGFDGEREVSGEVVLYFERKDRKFIVIEEPDGKRTQVEVEQFDFMEQLEFKYTGPKDQT